MADLESHHMIPNHMSYIDRVINHRFTHPLLSTLCPNIININTHIMSAYWLVIFFDVLAGHVMDYALLCHFRQLHQGDSKIASA